MTVRFTLLASLCAMLLILPGCRNRERGPSAIIPLPLQMQPTEGRFILSAATRLEFDKEETGLSRLAAIIRDEILPRPEPRDPESSNTRIRLIRDPQTPGGPEAYTLTIDSEQILLQSSGLPGLFYGIQTLGQLLPPGHRASASSANVTLQAQKIHDRPRFHWRGLHLDCCRHFMPVEFIKRYLDHMAMYKLNTFHWHLTEDQGWRIEIKAFPKLTEIGAWRKESRVGHASETPARYDGQPHGGFYTQDEVREIVTYAARRFITVVPELEMPGHAQAAIAAYPELGCTGEPLEVWTDWGVSPHIFNVEEATFTFLEKVIDEMVDLFPGPWFHVGGDEAPKDQWRASPRIQERMKELGVQTEAELQSYFITRMEKYLSSKGKKIIGWDEILEGGLAPNAAVMSWRGTAGGIAAAKAGHQVVMSPGSHCYYDHYQADPKTEPLAIGGYTPLIRAYQFDPVPPELPAEAARYVLGGQANLWTEYIPTPEHAEYMLFPRIAALAECLWTDASRKNWPDFKRRVKHHQKGYEALGIKYCPKTLEAEEKIGD
jgi:hexosaminidase